MIGIYCIQNLCNGKVYIGQSINIQHRWSEHVKALENNSHINKYLQKSWNKYGQDNFEFFILEECARDILTEWEQYWIDYYGGINSQNTYNCRDAGGNGKLSDEIRQKISKLQKGKPKKPGRKVSDWGRKVLSESHKGIYPSKETRQKMSLAQRNRKHTEETKRKIGETNRQKYIDNPELREEVAKRMRGRTVSEETRYKLGSANRGKSYKDNVEVIKKHSEGLKRAYLTGKKKAVWITVNGVTKMQSEWANIIGMTPICIINQRRKGEGYAEKYIADMLIKKNIKLE